MTTTPRRWFSFSLRTLFVVVTLGCCWLGWQLNIVRERKAAMAWIADKGGNMQEWEVPENPSQWLATRPRLFADKYWHISRIRRWRGDRPFYYISLVHTDATWEQRQDVASLFPEAFVMPERPHKTNSKTALVTLSDHHTVKTLPSTAAAAVETR